MRLWALVLLLTGIPCSAALGAQDVARHHAVLVGATKYFSLPASRHLNGPANDVDLMAKVLTSVFGFRASEIVKLSERQPDHRLRPRFSNIVREMEDLIKRVQSGDMVVVFLAGHGAQQPDDDLADPNDPEPDGLDEVYLPSDIGQWSEPQQMVTRAIRDDQIRGWLRQIRDRGAFVWFIADTCHSGTISRAGEISRGVLPGELVPEDAIEAARRRAQPVSAVSQQDSDLADEAGIVALYASQSNETAPEQRMPRDAPNGQYFGLLTYTISQILLRTGSAITYRELTQRVHQQYVRWGRSAPTPLLEGTDLDREVLGKRRWAGRSQMLLSRDGPGRWTVNAGLLHGVTTGCILSVKPPGGSDRARLVGYVRVTRSDPLRSDVVACKYNATPIAATLPVGGRCEVVFVSFGRRRLRIAAESADARRRDQVATKLKQMAAQASGSSLAYVESVQTADFVVGVTDGNLYLSRSTGAAGRQPVAPEFGPVPLQADWDEWLETSLHRIAKVTNLLGLASAGGVPSTAGDLDVDLQMVRFGRNRRDYQIVPWKNGRRMRDGDIVAFQLYNRGHEPADVTILAASADYKLTALFPPSALDSNRIGPGEKLLTVRAKLSAEAEPEHVVMIAVRSQRQREPFDFSWLAQPAISRARGDGQSALTPLERMLATYAFGSGQTRGLAMKTVRTYSIRTLTWQTLSRDSHR